MGDEDGNNMDDMTGYETSWVRGASLDLEDRLSVLLPPRSELGSAVSRMVKSVVHEIL